MTPVRTVLKVEPLDDRALPAVTFTDAGVAAGFVDLAQGPIQSLTERLGQTEPKRQAAFIAASFPGIAAAAFAAEQTLNAFLSDVQTLIVANPGNDDLVRLAFHTFDKIQTAELEVSYANSLGVLYGGTAFNPGAVNPDLNPNLRTTIPDLSAPGWVTQPNGLRIRDRIIGTGTPVAAGATVTVEYIGWLTNGTKFDASADHGGTSQFSLNQVIVGWQQGVPGMRPGGIRQLYVPAALAYGAAGFPPNVPPNSDLVFEIKMISSP